MRIAILFKRKKSKKGVIKEVLLNIWLVIVGLIFIIRIFTHLYNVIDERKCCHDMQELTHITVKNEQGDTVGHEFILVCKKCGKVRKVRL